MKMVFFYISEYATPFLDDLKQLNNFHAKSQWLYFVNLQVQPKLVNINDYGEHYALSEDLLAHVITPLEKKLASHVSKHPCLNFVLFIPPCNLSPLHIYTSKGHRIQGADAFLSPRWGGIQIYNPDRYVIYIQSYECLHLKMIFFFSGLFAGIALKKFSSSRISNKSCQFSCNN